MFLKHRVAPLLLPREQEMDVSQEDAWLNDVGPLPQQPEPSQESEPEEAPQSHPEPSQESEPEEAPLLHSEPSQESEPEEAPPLTPTRGVTTFHSDLQPVIAESISPASPSTIGPGHRLWPIVLRLSEHIWQELSQKTTLSSYAETSLTKFVQKKAVDLLRAEPQIARQIRDVAEAELVLHSIDNEVYGYGPLESLMKDASVSEITVIGPRFAYIERNGRIEDVPCSFEDDHHMLRIIENMLRKAGRHLTPGWPIVDARLSDGSLVNVVLPPSSVNGPTITIRKGSKKPLSLDDLVQSGTMSHEMADFLRACIQVRLNIAICGGVNAGRTTLLNALCTSIPAEERIATIEEVAELQLSQRHLVTFIAQLSSPGNADGVSMRDLVHNALGMKSERIILGECRGSEVIEIIQAMYNGCRGILMALYANDLRNCLARLERMYLAGGTTMPVKMIREQISTSLDVIVHISRLRDGSRKVLNIAEVQSTDGDTLKLQSIFHYKDASFDAEPDQIKGSFESGGFSPTFLPNFEAMGISLPIEMFQLNNQVK
jgi:pilus assembly protein CpaF